MVKQSNDLDNVIHRIFVLLFYCASVCVSMSVFICPSVCYHLAKNDQAGGPETYFKLCLALYTY